MKTLLTVLLLATPLAADTSGRVEAPKHPWLGYKPGSWVKYKYLTKFNNNPTEMAYTMTLLEVTKTAYKLEYLTEQNGVTNKHVQEIKEGQDQMSAYKKGDSGKETITVGGKRYNCTWTEYTFDQGGANMVYKMKTWSCPGVVGGTVKMEGGTEGQNLNMSWSMEIVEFKRK